MSKTNKAHQKRMNLRVNNLMTNSLTVNNTMKLKEWSESRQLKKSLRETKTKSKANFKINKSLITNFPRITNLKHLPKSTNNMTFNPSKEENHHDRFLRLKRTSNRNWINSENFKRWNNLKSNLQLFPTKIPINHSKKLNFHTDLLKNSKFKNKFNKALIHLKSTKVLIEWIH